MKNCALMEMGVVAMNIFRTLKCKEKKHVFQVLLKTVVFEEQCQHIQTFHFYMARVLKIGFYL